MKRDIKCTETADCVSIHTIHPAGRKNNRQNLKNVLHFPPKVSFVIKKDVIILKIEKLNENQIRCTLTRADLAARQLKLNELAYGSEKVKLLFRDMMQQASFDLGFDAENFPLMIEAIPSTADTIVLIITRVSDPEEMDTRFSKFTPFQDDGDDLSRTDADMTQSQLQLFAFGSLDASIRAAGILPPVPDDRTKLFYDRTGERYILLIQRDDMDDELFTHLCHVLSEYAAVLPSTQESPVFLEEQYETIFEKHALENLASISHPSENAK